MAARGDFTFQKWVVDIVANNATAPGINDAETLAVQRLTQLETRLTRIMGRALASASLPGTQAQFWVPRFTKEIEKLKKEFDPTISSLRILSEAVDQSGHRFEKAASKVWGYVKSLNSISGRGSPLSLIGRSLFGYGALLGITQIGKAVGQTADQIYEALDKYKEGTATFWDVYTAGSTAIPLAGGTFEWMKELGGEAYWKKRGERNDTQVENAKELVVHLDRALRLDRDSSQYAQDRARAEVEYEQTMTSIIEKAPKALRTHLEDLAAQHKSNQLANALADEEERKAKAAEDAAKRHEEESKRLAKLVEMENERYDMLKHREQEIRDRLDDRAAKSRHALESIHARGSKAQGKGGLFEETDARAQGERDVAIERNREQLEDLERAVNNAREQGATILWDRVAAVREEADRVLKLTMAEIERTRQLEKQKVIAETIKKAEDDAERSFKHHSFGLADYSSAVPTMLSRSMGHRIGVPPGANDAVDLMKRQLESLKEIARNTARKALIGR